jgi:hypothetical protein
MNAYILCVVSNSHTVTSIMAADMEAACIEARRHLAIGEGMNIDDVKKVNDTTLVFEGFGYNASLMQLNPED